MWKHLARCRERRLRGATERPQRHIIVGIETLYCMLLKVVGAMSWHSCTKKDEGASLEAA